MQLPTGYSKYTLCTLIAIILPGKITCLLQFDNKRYQDSVINGKIVEKGQRDCELRYAVLRSFLEQYKRPFTALDIGANKGYFSLRAAYEFPHGTFVMIEGEAPGHPDVTSQLLELCRANTELDNIIVLFKLVAPSDLKRLSECEHFDVVFAFNIFDHFGIEGWREVIDAVLNMADHVIVENPPQEPNLGGPQNGIRQDIEDYLFSQGGKLLAKVKRHTSDTYSSMILVSNPGGVRKRKAWLTPPARDESYVIQSDFERKSLSKNVKPPKTCRTKLEWHRGINLVTFKMMNGVYPEIDTIKQLVKQTGSATANDWVVHNMILQGLSIKLIDQEDTNQHGHPLMAFSQQRLEDTLTWLELADENDIERIFREKLSRGAPI